MKSQSILHKPIQRRTFLYTSGSVIAGTLFSCSKSGTQQNGTHTGNNSHTVFSTKSPTIRVRIGRVRANEKVLVGENTVGLTSGGWKTAHKHAKNNTGDLVLYVSEPTTVTVGKNTKQISHNVICVRREDESPRSFDVVLHVPIENYIPGVLAGELYAHWHPTTFEAQAIAARSYATSLHVDRKNKSHYDVNDGPSSQMYVGDVQLDSALRATEKTKGQVLTWNNSVIPAYYSACCGGLAATATDEISSSSKHTIPPLQGRGGKDACVQLESREWEVKRPSRTIRKRVNACATQFNAPLLASIRTIRSIEPIAHNMHGRPIQLAISDRFGKQVVVSSKLLIRALNANIVRLPDPAPVIWSSNLVGEKNGSYIQFRGVGMGHGVGLCQYGAQELAGKGEHFESILDWYYPSATLSTLL